MIQMDVGGLPAIPTGSLWQFFSSFSGPWHAGPFWGPKQRF